MKFGTSLSLRRQVEDDINKIESIDGAVAVQAAKLVKETENEKAKPKKRGRKKKEDTE